MCDMHNNDLITGGVSVVLGRLAAKHTFIICNLSFRGAEETGRLRQRNQTLCEIEAGLSHSKHECASNHMWTICPSPTASCSITYKTCRPLLCDKKGAKRKKKNDLFSGDSVFVFKQHCFLKLHFQDLSLLSRSQCDDYLLKDNFCVFI